MKNFIFPQIFQPVLGHCLDGVRSSNHPSTCRLKTENNIQEYDSKQQLDLSDSIFNNKIKQKDFRSCKATQLNGSQENKMPFQSHGLQIKTQHNIRPALKKLTNIDANLLKPINYIADKKTKNSGKQQKNLNFPEVKRSQKRNKTQLIHAQKYLKTKMAKKTKQNGKQKRMEGKNNGKLFRICKNQKKQEEKDGINKTNNQSQSFSQLSQQQKNNHQAAQKRKSGRQKRRQGKSFLQEFDLEIDKDSENDKHLNYHTDPNFFRKQHPSKTKLKDSLLINTFKLKTMHNISQQKEEQFDEQTLYKFKTMAKIIFDNQHNLSAHKGHKEEKQKEKKEKNQQETPQRSNKKKRRVHFSKKTSIEGIARNNLQQNEELDSKNFIKSMSKCKIKLNRIGQRNGEVYAEDILFDEEQQSLLKFMRNSRNNRNTQVKKVKFNRNMAKTQDIYNELNYFNLKMDHFRNIDKDNEAIINTPKPIINSISKTTMQEQQNRRSRNLRQNMMIDFAVKLSARDHFLRQKTIL